MKLSPQQFWFVEGILKKRSAEATKSFSPCAQPARLIFTPKTVTNSGEKVSCLYNILFRFVSQVFFLKSGDLLMQCNGVTSPSMRHAKSKFGECLQPSYSSEASVFWVIGTDLVDVNLFTKHISGLNGAPVHKG